MDLCRVCLFKTEQTCHIFSDAKNGQQIAEVLTNFAPIQIEEGDGLPVFICSNCEEKLNSFVDFQTLIIDTDFKLRQTKSLTDDDPLMNISDLHPEPLLIIPKEEPQCDVIIKEEADEEVSDSFRKKRDRKRHLKLFHCTYCDKGFRYNHELVAHTSLHTGTTPHVCADSEERSSRYRRRSLRAWHPLWAVAPFKMYLDASHGLGMTDPP
jgi:hypothetical protein